MLGRRSPHLPLSIAFLLLVRCSDAGSNRTDGPLSAPDSVALVDLVAVADTSPSEFDVTDHDLNPVDAGSSPDHVGSDAVSPDGSAADQSGDGPSQPPTLWGYVTLGITPALDGKGPLYIGLHGGFFPPPLLPVAQVVIQADLLAPGSKVKYEFVGVANDNYTVFAFLDDNANALPILAAPDQGDLVQTVLPKVALTGVPIQQDLVLDQVEGNVPGLTDAGVVSNGSVKGTIRASAAPSIDGKGVVYISLYDQPPPTKQPPLAQTNLPAGDLSSPFKSEPYYLANLAPGNYYLRVFLDDNNSVNFLALGPDKGDMVHSAEIPVRVEPGQLAAVDVVLDQLHP
jgi:hypothetical protein